MKNPIASKSCRLIFFVLAFTITTGELVAQKFKKPVHDTSFYASYPERLVIRIFGSQKYASFQLKNENAGSELSYKPNGTPAIGIGATYRTLALNIAYATDYLNNQDEKGETKKLDVQARVYARKWAIDVFGQLYESYYLSPKGMARPDQNTYYIRPDLKLSLVGISAYKLFNYKKFTLRPAFLQDERQLKSAGSFLAGAEIYYGKFRGDSSITPVELASLYERNDIQSVQLIRIGPGAGYAYTQVLPYNFFLTGTLTLNLNLGHIKETGLLASTTQVSANANFFYRLAAGYDNGNTMVHLFWINNRISAMGEVSKYKYVVNTGNFRLIIAKRFQPRSRTKKSYER